MVTLDCAYAPHAASAVAAAKLIFLNFIGQFLRKMGDASCEPQPWLHVNVCEWVLAIKPFLKAISAYRTC